MQQLIQDGAITALVRELALQSQLIARDANVWTLQTAGSVLLQSADRLQAALQTALQAAGHPVTLRVQEASAQAVTGTPAQRNRQLALAREQAARELLMSDPFVQRITRELGAIMVKGSLKAG